MTSKKRRAFLILLIMTTCALGGTLLVRSPNTIQIEAAQSPIPRYIFIFLADGAGISHLELTKELP